MSLEPVPALAVFRQRIGLIALAFTGAHGRDQIARRLVRDAARSGDGYVAKEVLEDATCTEIMSSSDCDKLTTTVEAAGLATGSMPLHLEQGPSSKWSMRRSRPSWLTWMSESPPNIG
ncbi:hypothetical protein [Streptomyces sp. Adlamb9]|uniref:hypothetical protein n=1 Tax=Streptomyces sp. Adlamb9 TaxID=3400629 RepID=UPI003F1DDEC5